MKGTTKNLLPEFVRKHGSASSSNRLNKFGKETHSEPHLREVKGFLTVEWVLSQNPQDSASQLLHQGAPPLSTSVILSTCPAELQPWNFPFCLHGWSPKGCSWWRHLLVGIEYVTQAGLAMILQRRADKCVTDNLEQSVKWWGKAVQQQESDQLSRKLLGLGQLVLSKGICPIEA